MRTASKGVGILDAGTLLTVVATITEGKKVGGLDVADASCVAG